MKLALGGLSLGDSQSPGPARIPLLAEGIVMRHNGDEVAFRIRECEMQPCSTLITCVDLDKLLNLLCASPTSSIYGNISIYLERL